MNQMLWTTSWRKIILGLTMLVALIVASMGIVGAERSNGNLSASAPRALPVQTSHAVLARGSIDLAKLPTIPSGSAAASSHASSRLHSALTPERTLNTRNAPLPTQKAASPTNAQLNPSFVGGSVLPPLYKSFEGLNDSQSGPVDSPSPDPGLATDLSYVMEAVENAVGIFRTSTGALAYGPYSTDSFFQPVKLNGDIIDFPQATYDVMRDRWIVVYGEYTEDMNGFPTHGYLDIAISKTNSPTQPTPGAQYWEYRIDANTFGGTIGSNCLGPTLGMDYWGLYIGCVATENTTLNPLGNTTIVIPKNSFYGGGGSTFFSVNNLPTDINTCGAGGTDPCPAYWISPVIEDGTPDAEYVVAEDGTFAGTHTNLSLGAFTNTAALATPAAPTFTYTLTTLPTPYVDPLLTIPQPGTAFVLHYGRAMKQVQYRGGRLAMSWTTLVNVGGTDTNGVYWAEVEPSLSTQAAHNPQWINGMQVRNSGIFAYDVATKYAFMPVIWASAEDDLALAFIYVSTGDNVQPSIAYTARRASDIPNTMGQIGASSIVMSGAHFIQGFMGANLTCALPLNSVTRGIVYCVSQYPGSRANPGWNTRIFALRTE